MCVLTGCDTWHYTVPCSVMDVAHMMFLSSCKEVAGRPTVQQPQVAWATVPLWAQLQGGLAGLCLGQILAPGPSEARDWRASLAGPERGWRVLTGLALSSVNSRGRCAWSRKAKARAPDAGLSSALSLLPVLTGGEAAGQSAQGPFHAPRGWHCVPRIRPGGPPALRALTGLLPGCPQHLPEGRARGVPAPSLLYRASLP